MDTHDETCGDLTPEECAIERLDAADYDAVVVVQLDTEARLPRPIPPPPNPDSIWADERGDPDPL